MIGAFVGGGSCAGSGNVNAASSKTGGSLKFIA
jgi:hypothetical protein